jgi:hypothetical protein
MLVIDSFTFYNELEILECRLKTLYEVVDYFILVEATKTYRGLPKTLYYEDNKKRYSQYSDKIIHIVLDNLIENANTDVREQWINENNQRRAIDKGIKNLNLQDEDIIIISDADEIPDSRTIHDIKITGLQDIHILEMDLYYYNIECKHKAKWHLAKIMPYSFYKNERDPQKFRMYNTNLIKNNGGWHLSYFGNRKFIENKIKNFSHAEFDNEEIINNIDDKIARHIDLYGRKDTEILYIKKSDNTYLPPYIPNCMTIN